MLTLTTKFDAEIGFWFFAVHEGERLLHLLHGFQSREEAQQAGESWLRDHSSGVSIGVESNPLEELAHVRVRPRHYTDLTIGEIASDLAALAGWRVVGSIHAQTAITIEAHNREGNVLEALEDIAQLAGLKLRAGSEPWTVEIGIF